MKDIRDLLKRERQGRVTVAKQCTKCKRWFTTRQRIQTLCPKCAAKEGHASR